MGFITCVMKCSFSPSYLCDFFTSALSESDVRIAACLPKHFLLGISNSSETISFQGTLQMRGHACPGLEIAEGYSLCTQSSQLLTVRYRKRP
jgi:hypothetical protein